MSKINTGTRSKVEDDKALADLIEQTKETGGKEVVVENGATYIVDTVMGLTVKTRIA